MEIPIQVAVQIFPEYPNEQRCVETIAHFTDNNANNLSLTPEHLSLHTDGVVQVNASNIQQTYRVQHALPYHCPQEYIYSKTVYPLIAMFLDGYDASIVTYGQHGTGKTHTMHGPGLDCLVSESDYGLVQRSVRDIFVQLMKRQCDYRFALNLAWIEICGNEVHDILGGGVVQCFTIGDVFQCLQIGMTNRSQEACHSLLTMTLEQQWVNADGLIQHRLSTASFCDLCGTERMLAVNNFNQQISLPKDLGLQALERIVGTICDPNFCMLDNSNVNLMNQYEETTLTKLLKDSFGGRAQTLVILCVSPLEQDVIETTHNLEFAHKVQFVRNIVMLNTFSDNNLPLANFISLPTTIPPSLPEMHYNAMIDKITANNNSNATFGLKFAATQWLKLVSNAEGLFSKLLINNKSLNEQERECIEEWMFLKQECEECLSSGELVANPRLLGPIQETDEPDETGVINDVEQKKHYLMQIESMVNTTLTDNESDSEDIMQQTEYLEEQITDLMHKFSQKTNEMIDERYNEFIKTYPKAITDSFDNNKHNMAMVLKEENPGKKMQRSTSIALPANSSSGGRRKSIQPGGSNSDALMLSSADLEHLQKIANESLRNSPSLNLNNSVCREAAKFLDSSNEMHPLRIANANKAQDILQNDIINIDMDLKAKEEQIKALRETIVMKEGLIARLVKDSETHVKAKQKFQQKKRKYQMEKETREKELKSLTNSRDEIRIVKLKSIIERYNKFLNDLAEMKKIASESDNKIKELQKSLQESRKQLNALSKAQKKDRKLKETLEEKLKQEILKEAKDDKRSITVGTNIDTRIKQLDYVLKEKDKILKLNCDEGDRESSIRREIRNFRSERDRLLDERCSFNEKQMKDKTLSEQEAQLQLLGYDVAVEVIDSAIEFKNEEICELNVSSNKMTTTKTVDRFNRQHRPTFPQLMNQLYKLNEKEMRSLLYKCLQKIIDLRDSSRQLELQIVQFERERNQWKLSECNMYNAIQHSRLVLEREALELQRQREAKITLMLQVAAEDGGNMSNNSSMLMSPNHADLLQMIPATNLNHRRHQYLENANTNLYRHQDPQKLMAVTNTTTTVATAASSTRHTAAERNGYQKHKVNKNIFSKMFPRTYGNVTNGNHNSDKRNLNANSTLVLANQLQAPMPLPEAKVTRVKNKIIIQQNK